LRPGLTALPALHACERQSFFPAWNGTSTLDRGWVKPQQGHVQVFFVVVMVALLMENTMGCVRGTVKCLRAFFFQRSAPERALLPHRRRSLAAGPADAVNLDVVERVCTHAGYLGVS
jgi:hypothetical protein